MTGFASGQGAQDGFSWTWELRSVNARGLDLRLRVPDWLPDIERVLKSKLNSVLSRGSVTLNLRLMRDEAASAVQINTDALATVLSNLAVVEAQARSAGVTLAAPTSVDLMAMRGILDTAPEVTDTEGLTAMLLSDFQGVLDDFLRMRATEGLSLADIITTQLDQIEDLSVRANDLAQARLPKMEQTLRENLSRVLDNSDAMD
ncbi:MAG: YicC/YloC family endoribonuclease, partial [Halocynthiibacter sp.]